MKNYVLSPFELKSLLRNFNLSSLAWSYIEMANMNQHLLMNQHPLMKGQPGFHSRKMGCVFELSRYTTSFPIGSEYEYNPDILAYWIQPCLWKFTLPYKNIRYHALHVPDLLVVRRTSIWFEEWKSESALQSLTQEFPAYYTRHDKEQCDPDTPLDCVWICPPAVAAAAEIGFDYRVRTLGQS
jgi:putative transposase